MKTPWKRQRRIRRVTVAAAERAVKLACYLEVTRRAKGFCERCHVVISAHRPVWHPQRAHMNHKVPRSQGGKDTPENCELICGACHLPGGQHAPTEERMKVLQHAEGLPAEWSE